MIEFHSIFTLVSLLVFIGIVAFTYSRGQKKNMDAAAQIPLQDDVDPAPAVPLQSHPKPSNEV